jgi:Tfp pilus assembly protein PilF
LIARGAAYANKKELKAAAKDFKAALKIDGDHPDARKYLDSVRARSTAAKNARRSLKAGEFVLVCVCV